MQLNTGSEVADVGLNVAPTSVNHPRPYPEVSKPSRERAESSLLPSWFIFVPGQLALLG